MNSAFEASYKGLNTAQKKAVDTIEGPVMVVAGPGTGKTQILSLRIANILKKTDIQADGILCLTFTRAGVKAMRERLLRYIGESAQSVIVQTFHSFALTLIEENFELLDFENLPTLLKDDDAVLIIDELLHSHDWQYLYSRSNPAQYFGDLKSLVSLLKRERLSAQDLVSAIEVDIKNLESDPENLSSRGPTKGELKKDVQSKIASLSRTKEVAEFYEKYEELKKARSLMDYDDVLEYAVKLVEENESVRADLRENYLYIHVDEHQDSSGVQNSFLRAVWQETDQPNIFVVGDDRQLIYGFGGASLSYFEEFKTMFGKAELITLVENYRSSEPILTLAENLLQSSLTKEKLKSNHTAKEPVVLSEYKYPRDEILGAGLYFKKQIENGMPANEIALLVPKNRQVRTAVKALRDLGLPVQANAGESFFESSEYQDLRTVLNIVAEPFNGEQIAKSLLSKVSSIPALTAHAFLYENKNKNISIKDLLEINDGLFDTQNPIFIWGQKLNTWLDYSQKNSLLDTVHKIGNELLVETANDHEGLIHRVEIVRTFIHLLSERAERNNHARQSESLPEFLNYLTRLENYNHTLPIATFENDQGISVLTLHGSKGLEYESVWIAHMNESTLMSNKRNAFSLPAVLENSIEKKNKEVAKRELYVAITRAKKFLQISYANTSYTGAELELAEILSEVSNDNIYNDSSLKENKKLKNPVSKNILITKNQNQTEAELLSHDPKIYVEKKEVEITESISELRKKVSQDFSDAKISVTLLNNFFECPWKWYFRNLLKLPEAKTNSLKFGSAVHGTIEKILNEKKKPTESFVKKTLTEQLEKEGINEKALLTRLARDGQETVGNWLEKFYPNLAKDRKSERSISYKDKKFPELTMYGKIDLTERFPDGTIVVTDFKTGSTKTAGAIEKRDDEGRLSDSMRQLAMYSYLIAGAENGQKVDSSRLLYLEAKKTDKNALYSASISNEEIELLERDISDYQKLLKSGEWLNRPCNYKPYAGNNTECEHCALARRIYHI